ncbi:methyltransferase type 11 [Nostoc linckia z18]|jgi:ubiquinone/menaquinone biosynthesis C-methylase UbiE|uniref:Methyltransferase type 11 n=2 Tax=Nostoc linckia TaxID=92942 RepID=A0A9Q5ZCM3_NOSLI|nr:class I SAM-dependent methyltransferase [Nostoc linckia]PHK41013.1 methyltransferase type 11 [Nostoc linckia z15]PHK45706.1 methyltransferase type 11 [Nostoc linckia z16]PHJ65237.1 methyltransferase type 11 [Nostoc linckia z1]PHJ70266.1 methyltransferase type 11 [Nostoc linckia z3]PHJ75204.1 methyltransferase type 11 [Nostoc linckia z2]
MAIYEQIGKSYDLTRRADPEIANRLAVKLQIKSDYSYLDVACGTGNYTLALAKHGGVWHGIDQSIKMIDAAKNKSNTIAWEVGEVETLPYVNGSFSGVLCTLAIHHFTALIPAFREIYRVLAAGNFVLFTATPEQMRKYWLVEYFPEAMYKSAEQMPNLENVKYALKESGFELTDIEPYYIGENLQDLFLYSGKYHPEIYLDENVRSGISTFALLASAAEIATGCERLAADIDTGRITEIIKKYENNRGDYLFITAEKY